MIFRKLHSIEICFTVNSWFPSHWSHNGGWGLFSILNECVKRVWPIRPRAINNNFIFSICASQVILLTNLGHDGMQSVIHLFIPPFLPQRWDIRPDFHKKTSVHRSSKFSGCVFDKASFAARLASSFPLISLWLGSQQNVINLPLDNISWHACKILFTRGFLLSWLSMACNTDILSENITKRSTVETFTYFTYLVNRFYLCSKYTATIS